MLNIQDIIRNVLSENKKEDAEMPSFERQIDKHSKREEMSIHKSNDIKDDSHYSLENYTFQGSRMINSDLHKHFRNKKYKIDRYGKSDIKHLDDLLDKASMDRDTHVYTGIPESPARAFKLYKAHGTLKVHLPAYTSTSTSFDFVHEIHTHSKDEPVSKKGDHTPFISKANKKHKAVGHILKIQLPKGTKAGSIRSSSEYKSENEILLHRGHNIEIHPRPTVMGDGTHIWHARVISHTPMEIK